MLLLAIALGILIGLPQIIPTLRYLPKSVRSGRGWRDKCRIGNMPLAHLSTLLTGPKVGQVDGVFYPEMCIYVGITCALLAPFSTSLLHSASGYS